MHVPFQGRIEASKIPVLQKMLIFGGALSMDGATVHGEPLSNYVVTVPTVRKPVHMKVVNAKKHLAEGNCKDADYIAFGAIAVIKSTPDGGIHIVIVAGDTASDEVLAACLIATECPWVSYVPCPFHLSHLLLE